MHLSPSLPGLFLSPFCSLSLFCPNYILPVPPSHRCFPAPTPCNLSLSLSLSLSFHYICIGVHSSSSSPYQLYLTLSRSLDSCYFVLLHHRRHLSAYLFFHQLHPFHQFFSAPSLSITDIDPPVPLYFLRYALPLFLFLLSLHVSRPSLLINFTPPVALACPPSRLFRNALQLNASRDVTRGDLSARVSLDPA